VKVYPASRDRQRCIDFVALLNAAGHEVTHNWAIGPKCAYDATDAAIAATDLMAVRASQVLVLLWEDGMLGANIECGAALAYGKRVIVVGWFDDKGRQGDRNVFYRLPQVMHVSTPEEAISLLALWQMWQEYDQQKKEARRG
jgi:hypothetical protein